MTTTKDENAIVGCHMILFTDDTSRKNQDALVQKKSNISCT